MRRRRPPSRERRAAFAVTPLAVREAAAGHRGGEPDREATVDFSDRGAGHRFDYARFPDDSQIQFYSHFENAMAEAVLTVNLSEAEQRGLGKKGQSGESGGTQPRGGQLKNYVKLLPRNRRTHTLFLHPSLMGLTTAAESKSELSAMTSKSGEDQRDGVFHAERKPKGAPVLTPKVLNDPDMSRSLFRLHNREKCTENLMVTLQTSHAPRALANLQCVTKRCRYNTLCKGAVATRKCFSCVEYDPELEGLFCEACFQERHPWYRVKHRWCAIQDAPNPERDWLNQLHVIGKERELELLQLQQYETLKLQQQLEKVYSGDGDSYREAVKSRIGHVRHQYKNMEETVRRVMKLSDPVKSRREEMAIRVQRMWRMRKSWMALRGYMNSIVKSYKDEATGQLYYVNTKTGKITWKKPGFYGSCRFTSKREAVRFVQRSWRRRRTQKAILDSIAVRFRKIWDTKRFRFYYFDTFSQKTSWKKPRLLGSRDLPVFQNGSAPDAETAARMLQGAWRRRRARTLVLRLIHHNFEKVWDSTRNAFYYYNKKTCTSSWVKPKLLGLSQDVVVTPRSAAAAAAAIAVEKNNHEEREARPNTDNMNT